MKQGLFEKVYSIIADGGDYPLMDQKDLKIHFNKKEIVFIEEILNFHPRDFGLKYKFFGIGRVQRQLMVKIENQEYNLDGKIKIIKPQFLPKNVFDRFQEMNEVMEADIGHRLNVYSGYRSPTYQALTFFHVLYSNNLDMKKTLKKVALPGCSEHSNVKKQGVDFAPTKGISQLKNFYKTTEYMWLCKNASKFRVHLSYPKGNGSGIFFEPWHWHFKK